MHSASAGTPIAVLSDVITYAATIKLLVTSHDLSQWRCHYCEPADSKMAEIRLTVEVNCCAGDKCVSSLLFSCTYTCAYPHIHTGFVVTQSVLPDELLGCVACSKISQSVSVSSSHPG